VLFIINFRPQGLFGTAELNAATIRKLLKLSKDRQKAKITKSPSGGI